MAEAAGYFTGDHDFTSFAASTGSEDEDVERLTVRTIFQSRFLPRAALPPIHRGAEEWIYEVRGRSFMRNMVRKMVGTLLEVGRGKLAASDIPELFALRDRTQIRCDRARRRDCALRAWSIAQTISESVASAARLVDEL